MDLISQKEMAASWMGWKPEGYIGSDGPIYVRQDGHWISMGLWNPQTDNSRWKKIFANMDEEFADLFLHNLDEDGVTTGWDLLTVAEDKLWDNLIKTIFKPGM